MRAPKKRKLTFKELEELAALPAQIDKCEQERSSLYESLADPAFLRDGVAVSQSKARLVALDLEITRLTDRWEALETIAAEAGQNQ